MQLKILQIDKESCAYKFMSYAFASKHNFNLEDYKEVWSGNIDSDNSLESIFRMFNRVTQEDAEFLEAINFKGHSLSISDIIDLEGHKYYCDSFGWKEL